MAREPFLFGAAWYPEWEPEGAWEGDLIRMREAGLNAVRIAEFSWEQIWPAPERFDFSLYDQVVARCAELGMAVVLGIDTVRPPSWLFEREPDIRMVDNLGRSAPGMWPSHCFNHPRFTEWSSQYIREVVTRYKLSPALRFYQVDNEPAYHYRGEAARDPHRYYCWCTHCKTTFAAWLTRKYAERPDQAPRIPTPFPGADVMGELLWIEWRTFHDETNLRRTAWVIEQVRAYDGAHPVTTNTMPMQALGSRVSASCHDVTAMARELDVFGMDFYGDVRRDYEAREALAYSASRHWAGGRGFHCLELQPTTLAVAEGGWKNQERGFAKHGDDRRLIPWGWRPVAYGARSVFYWVWRLQQPTVWALCEPDGRVNEYTVQTARLAKELAAVWPYAEDSRPLDSPAVILTSRPVHHLAARQGLENLPAESCEGAFTACWSRRIQADIVDVREAVRIGLSQYRAVLAPQLSVVSRDLAAVLTEYVREGGVVVADTRFAAYGDPLRENGSSFIRLCVTDVPVGDLREVAGYRVRKSYAAPEVRACLTAPLGPLAAGTEVRGVANWDVVEPSADAEVIAAFKHGAPALLRRRYGQGALYFAAFDLFRACCMSDGSGVRLLGELLREAGAQPAARVEDAGPDPLAVEVVLRRRPDASLLVFVLNSSPQPVRPVLVVPAQHASAIDRLTGSPLACESNGRETRVPLEIAEHAVTLVHCS